MLILIEKSMPIYSLALDSFIYLDENPLFNNELSHPLCQRFPQGATRLLIGRIKINIEPPKPIQVDCARIYPKRAAIPNMGPNPDNNHRNGADVVGKEIPCRCISMQRPNAKI